MLVAMVFTTKVQIWIAAATAVVIIASAHPNTAQIVKESSEEKALTYLEQEVPAWPRKTNCFSCHNNGDAARALFRAHQMGYAVPEESIADTREWLLAPSKWESSPGSPVVSDKKLALIQFAAALAEAVRTGVVEDPEPLIEASRMLVEDQDLDGSWRVEGDESMVASPATYGRTLATYMSRHSLETADMERFADPIARADAWLIQAPIGPIMDAAALVLALHDRGGGDARAQTQKAADWILNGQSSDGGWGPYPQTPSEPFDSALALVALARLGETSPSPSVTEAIARGRAFLQGAQLEDGGWIETTRPSGNQSYAEHISTSGWATLALLSTRSE